MSCRLDKEREHAAALQVLPDLLQELDQMLCTCCQICCRSWTKCPAGVARSAAGNKGVSCRLDKEREHAAALQVLPDLLQELDQMPPQARLTSLVEGILAGNIFDWGSKATVELYHNGTILEIYR